MERRVVVRGRLHGRNIELDEPVDDLNGEVEVVVRPVPICPAKPDVLDVIARLPPGTHSKAELDRRVQNERDSWSDRG